MTPQPKTEKLQVKLSLDLIDKLNKVGLLFQVKEEWEEWIRLEVESRLATVEKERDLAIAHDRQPYPTADAYETVCRVLEIVKKEREELRESKEFYKRRCDALQSIQKNMQEPERTAVCDILANGFIDVKIHPALASLLP